MKSILIFRVTVSILIKVQQWCELVFKSYTCYCVFVAMTTESSQSERGYMAPDAERSANKGNKHFIPPTCVSDKTHARHAYL